MIPKNHKCWFCIWATYVGTGFFCPLPKGVCVKQKPSISNKGKR